jgi:HPt (histidine-containing phosphotransfer) domain-containing protein
MDGFLAKPIDEAALHYELSRAIERQLQRGIELPPMRETGPGPGTGTGTGPSVAELDAMFGVAEGETAAGEGASAAPADRAATLHARMRAAFAADLPRRRAELRAAVDANDTEACARVLHGLRGSAAHLGATELAAMCAALEAVAEGGVLADIRPALPGLDAVLDTFEQCSA